MAYAVRLAWGLDVKPRCIDGRCCATCPGESCLHVLGNLVQADDEDNLLRPPRDGSHTVSVAIDVHDDAVLRDGIGAG